MDEGRVDEGRVGVYVDEGAVEARDRNQGSAHGQVGWAGPATL